MGIILPNTIPVPLYSGTQLEPYNGLFQTIEEMDYQSPAGAEYLAPAHRSFSIVSGAPPGLNIDSGSGIITGPAGICTSDQALIDAIKEFPGTISLSSYVTAGVLDPSTSDSYKLGDVVKIIYTFDPVVIMGIWDMPVGTGTVPIPVTKPFTIKILKNFSADITAYQSLDDGT